MILRNLVSFAALAVCSPSVLASPQQVLDAAAPAVQGLDVGLAAFDIDHIREDIFFLASDEMGGRDSPSPEQRIAARYIRKRLQKQGWQPGWKDSYLHPYQLPANKMDLESCGLTLEVDGETMKLELGSDYFFHLTARGRRSASGGAVWIDDLSKGDIDGFDLEGHWVVGEAKRGLSSKRRKELTAAGSLGAIVLPSEGTESTVAEVHGPRFAFLKRTQNFPTDEAKFGYLFLTEPVAERLTEALGDVMSGKALPLRATETLTVTEGQSDLENVMGLWPGSDPSLKNEVIILSAHYDHVGKRDNGDIYNGADDNGSGTTGLLALCEAIAAYGPMRRTIMLHWVSAEEKGLLGSRAWTQDPWLPEGMQPVCNVNIDMIGRNADDKLNITPTRDHPEYSWLTKVAEANSGEEGFPKLGNADAYYERSDHFNYRKNLGIPVAFLFSDVHDDYHKTSDTAEKINLDKIRRVGRLVLRMLHDLQGDELRR